MHKLITGELPEGILGIGDDNVMVVNSKLNGRSNNIERACRNLSQEMQNQEFKQGNDQQLSVKSINLSEFL